MRRIGLLGVVAVFALASVPARAASTTATYYVGFGRLVVNAPAAAGTVGVGGYSFAVESGDPASVKVVDQSGAGTAIMVCQEAGASEPVTGSCQDGGPGQLPGDDAVQKLCANGSAQPLSSAFRAGAGLTLAVFVYAADYTARTPNCSGAGTTGTITLTF